MSKATVQLCSVTLRHLTADGKRAAADIPTSELHHFSTDQLLALLRAVENIAPMVAFPADPEVRITAPTGNFVVRVKDSQLMLTSWSSAHKGGPTRPADIIAAVLNEQPETPRAVSHAQKAKSPGKERLTLVALGLAILLVNLFTVWVLTRPPRTVAANCRLLPPEPAERVLQEVAGTYETGNGPGDRRLEIRRDASGYRVKLGAAGAVKEEQTFTVKPGDAAGKRVLLTSRKSLITVRDSVSLVLYGDTYRRVLN